MASIREIARLAGVAPSTVSRALRNAPSISPATRERIRLVADAHQYSTDHWVQRLTVGRSRTIGVILPEVTTSFYARVLRGILEATRAANYHVLTVETHSQLLHTYRAIQSLVEQRVDAVLIANEHPDPIPLEAIQLLRKHGIVPIGLDSTPFSAPVDSVSTDENQLAETIVSYLMALGHRSIAFVGLVPSDRLFSRGEAMARIMRAHGLQTSNFVDTNTKDYRAFDAVHAWKQLLHAHSRPTAVITWEDRIAAKFVQSAAAQGIGIPQHMSVIGCANMEFAELLVPSLTTVEQHPEEIGRRAFALAQQRKGQGDGLPIQTITIPVSLVERASCHRPYIMHPSR
jgi:LacI family transcriptional regulator